MCLRLFQVALVVAVACSFGSALAQVEVETQVMGPVLDKDSGYSFSLVGQRLACAVGTDDGRGCMLVDGERGAAFDALYDPAFVMVSLSPELVWPEAQKARLARSEARRGPVVFSDDGTRCAYPVVREQELVVVVDGEDLWKAPAEGNRISGLEFSPHSRIVYHVRHPAQGSREDGFQLVVNGAAERLSYMQPFPVFNSDGTRYAYVATDLDRVTHHLIIDGEEAPYLGLKPVWTAADQLVTVAPIDPATQLVAVQLDGEKLLEAQVVERVIPAPAGKRVATLTRGNRAYQLHIDGEQVSNGPLIEDVFWSAEGARYGALCNTGGGTRLLLLDGEPGPEYGNISGVTFAPDGSRVHFVGYTNGQHVLVLDNERQSPASLMPIEPLMRADGELVYVLGVNLHQMTLVLGAEQLGPMREIKDLALSPVGARYALEFGPLNDGSVLIDGLVFSDIQTKPFVALGIEDPVTERFVFSPDGEHLLHIGWFKADTRAMGVFVDDALINTRSTNIARPQFTPDSQHVVWTERVPPHSNVMVDGQLAAQFDLGRSSLWERHSDVAAMSPDGVFTIMGPIDGSIVKLRITPDPATSVETLIAAASDR